MIHLGVLLFVASLPSEGAGPSCSPTCGCRALEAGSAVYRATRSTRRVAASVDQSQLENSLVEEAQTAAATAVDAVRGLHASCAAPPHSCSNGTRSCACRLRRLLNITVTAQRRLDDAAAGVLFGDSDENVLALSSALPSVLHSSGRVAAELERHGRRQCDSPAQAQHAGQAGAKRHKRSRPRTSSRTEAGP